MKLNSSLFEIWFHLYELHEFNLIYWSRVRKSFLISKFKIEYDIEGGERDDELDGCWKLVDKMI